LLGCASAQLRFFVASRTPVTVTDGERAPSVEIEDDEEEEDEDEEEPDVRWKEPNFEGWVEEEEDDDEEEEEL
jgi:hypothetical protein